MESRTVTWNRLTQSDTEIDTNRNEDIWVRKLESTLRSCRTRRTAREQYEQTLSFHCKKSPISRQNEIIIEELNLCSPSVSDDDEIYYNKIRSGTYRRTSSDYFEEADYESVNMPNGNGEGSNHIYVIDERNEDGNQEFDNSIRAEIYWAHLTQVLSNEAHYICKRKPTKTSGSNPKRYTWK